MSNQRLTICFSKPITLKIGEKQTNLLDTRKLLKNLKLSNTVISEQEASIKGLFIGYAIMSEE
ncbi:hypothetical protein E4U27_007220 [Claviceps purpurea]|nr:hypothetical protein E4U27_007220 [Claviceps purpurea]